jgi:Tol biopolymer transport system component
LVPDLSGQHGIFAINSDQTGGRLVTPDRTAQLRPSSWSPDGKKIAFFASHDEDMPMLQKYRMPLHFPLYWMDATGGNQKRLLDFPVSSFEFSRDGRHLLFVSAYEDPAHNDEDIVKGLKNPMSAVYLLNLQAGTQKRVTGFGQNCYASWSPDGKSVALSFGDTPQSSDLYTASVDGKHTRRLTNSPGIKIKPVWSPDSKRIAYVCFVSQPGGMTSNAYIVDADGSNGRKITNANPYEVSWSVEGKILLLRSTKGFDLVSTEGNTLVDMENKVIQPQDAVFTPDGKDVMFRSNHEGPWYLYAVDIKGANLRRISGNLSASMFCLSPPR